MHDPCTVAFDIKSPFWRRCSVTGRRYHKPLVTIWHVDPESDGSDDSCGWSSPKLAPEDRKIVDDMISWDLKFPYYTSPSLSPMGVVVNPEYSYKQLPGGETLALVAAVWQDIAWQRDCRRTFTAREWARIVSLATNPADNLRAILANEDDGDPERRARRFLHCIMRQYLSEHRRWWEHPRWHLWHWRLQVHPWQQLRRWLFVRCDRCGKRFGWNESPTGTWAGDKLWHSSCYGAEAADHRLRQTEPAGTA